MAKDKPIRITFSDGGGGIMYTHCRSCGKKVDKSLRCVSMVYYNRVYCWDCIEKKQKRLNK